MHRRKKLTFEGHYSVGLTIDDKLRVFFMLHIFSNYVKKILTKKLPCKSTKCIENL